MLYYRLGLGSPHVDLYRVLGLKEPRVESLGEFLTGTAPPREYQDLGVFVLYGDSPDEAVSSPTIQVEVISVSALFWRFTVERPAEDDSGERERLVVTTGSGTLEQYFPGVLAIAERCFTVKELP